MKEKLFALFWVLFFALPLYAQADKTGSYSIKGQVLDSLSNESVPYATLRIALAKTPDKPVKLLACDVDGKFQAPLSSAGKYIISMQSIGKAPAEKTFTISDKQRNLDLGKLYMQEDNQRLGEVTVTAQKPLVKAEIDKLTYSLEDDPEAQTNNTLEMLRKVPMVTVDGDDQIQLKGSTNFKIYMNGKPSNLLSNNPAEVLKSMPANSVKNIEVITDPGAKYDAEGIGGIINIITTKNALQGYTGTVRVNGSSLGRVGGGGYISLKAGKFGLTANYNYNYNREPWNESTSIREDLENDEVIPALRAEIQELDKSISNLLKLVEKGAESETLAARLTDLEKRKRDVERRLVVAEDDYIILDKPLIVRWLSQFLNGDIEDEDFRRQIIDLLVNSVTVWDEPDGYYKITSVYNLMEEEVKSFRVKADGCSDLRSQLPP